MVEQRKAEAAAAPARTGLRDLSLTLLVALAGCVGALGATRSGAPADPTAFLIWISIYAPAAGFLLGALGVRPWLFAPAAPGLWMVALTLQDIAAQRDLPTPLWSALAWTGLFAAGLGLGGWRAAGPRGASASSGSSGSSGWARALGGAGLLLLIGAALVALPGKGVVGERAGDGPEPWPPEVASTLLDLSPATLVLESAGVDWMRHRAVYEPVRTDRFQRLPYRGELAGPLALVVGCLLVFGAGMLARSTGGAEE